MPSPDHWARTTDIQYYAHSMEGLTILKDFKHVVTMIKLSAKPMVRKGT